MSTGKRPCPADTNPFIRIATSLQAEITSSFSKGVFHLFTSMALVQGFMLLQGIALARFLGPTNLGHVRVIQVVLEFALVAALLGMSSTVAKLVSEFRSEGKKGNVLFQGLVCSLAAAVLVSSSVFILSRTGTLIGDSVARDYLQLLCWTLPLLAITRIAVSDFHGRKEIRKMALTNATLGLFSLAVVCSMTYFWALTGYAAARICYVGLAGPALLFLLRSRIRPSWDPLLLKRMLRFGAFVLLAEIAGALVMTADTLCIDSILKDSRLVGYYGVAALAARGLMTVPNAMTQTAFPYLSEKAGSPREIWRQFVRLLKRTTVVMALVCCLAFFLTPLLVKALFGEEYAAAVPPLRVLLVGVFVYSIINVLGTTQVALGRVDISFYVTLVTGVCNVVFNIVLITRLGMLGAAYARVGTYALNLLLRAAWYWHYYRRSVKPSVRAEGA